MTNVLTETQPIRLKGRSFLALVLSPEQPFDDWLVRLDDLAAKSAGFFLRRPIVLDVANLGISRDELRDLINKLATRGVRIMGVEGAMPSQLDQDMPPAMSNGRPASDFEAPEEGDAAAPADAAQPAPPSEPQLTQARPSMIVTEPVRSGQSLIFDGDITVVGSVASGAEVVAGGSIHVYGALRGRAEAGATGGTDARIFCRRQEAELIAIGGYYQTAEDMQQNLRGHAVQIWLENDTIMAERLG